MLVIQEDCCLSPGAELYDTFVYLFDVTDGIIVVHPMHHVVLKFGPKAHLATLSDRLVAM